HALRGLRRCTEAGVQAGSTMTGIDVTAFPPPKTVAELRRILDQLPGEALVLVDGYEDAHAAVGAAVFTEVQELSGRPAYLGRFEHVADAARAAAGEDVAAWAISEPGPLPQRVGDPV